MPPRNGNDAQSAWHWLSLQKRTALSRKGSSTSRPEANTQPHKRELGQFVSCRLLSMENGSPYRVLAPTCGKLWEADAALCLAVDPASYIRRLYYCYNRRISLGYPSCSRCLPALRYLRSPARTVPPPRSSRRRCMCSANAAARLHGEM